MPSFSMAKSFTSALVGVLGREGRLEVGAPAPVPAWSADEDPRAAITLDDLLRMSSGLEWTEGADQPDSDLVAAVTNGDAAVYVSSQEQSNDPGTASDLALVLLEGAGRESEALALSDSIEAWLIRDDVDAQVRWSAARARALVRLGEPAEAERLARGAAALAWSTEYVNLRGLSQEALAEVLRRSDRANEATGALRKAIAVYEAKGNVVSAASARKALADLEAEAKAPRA